MLDSFYIGATGMNAQQIRIDAIANNVSNVNTTGFKKTRVSFEDMFYRRLNALAPLSTNQNYNQVGLGTAIARTDAVFTAGNLQQTNNDLDLAIKGSGFFEVKADNGDTLYTRLGSLRISSDGELLTQNGDKLITRIRIPADATKVTVSSAGAVTATVPTQQDPVVLGDLDLANFVNPEGLRSIGDGLYAKSDESGEPYLALPGENGVGTLAQGYLESSNVDLTTELVDLVVAQRAYQLNSRVVQISDDILSSIATLRR